ncbi:hypothetical protein NDU88_006657 [Pleurodeles waltl]|uniref:Uncharacterized protein n=1 Tax=Pleurodeles waltl TaxID=8319 RepID=A0AAV7LT72_PLEWA|nr:hypothetical protein NDU88_006657 [Pleurodeles waltl]
MHGAQGHERYPGGFRCIGGGPLEVFAPPGLGIHLRQGPGAWQQVECAALAGLRLWARSSGPNYDAEGSTSPQTEGRFAAVCEAAGLEVPKPGGDPVLRPCQKRPPTP